MESYKRVLIATDGSDYNKEAVMKGLSLAKLLDAKVTALFVVNQTAFASVPPDSLITNIYSLLNEEGEAAVEYVRKQGAEMGLDVQTKVVSGIPSHAIVEEGSDQDIIVIGNLGRTGLSKLLLGNVAEKVVRHAPCPVFVIRLKEED